MIDHRSGESEETVSDDEPPGGGGVTSQTDAMYRALASSTRRRILFHLLEETRMEVTELLDVLMGERATREGRVVTLSDRKEVEVALVHADLPLLGEADLVDYDGETVELRDLDEFVATTIRRAYEYDSAATADGS